MLLAFIALRCNSVCSAILYVLCINSLNSHDVTGQKAAKVAVLVSGPR